MAREDGGACLAKGWIFRGWWSLFEWQNTRPLARWFLFWEHCTRKYQLFELGNFCWSAMTPSNGGKGYQNPWYWYKYPEMPGQYSFGSLLLCPCPRILLNENEQQLKKCCSLLRDWRTPEFRMGWEIDEHRFSVFCGLWQVIITRYLYWRFDGCWCKSNNMDQLMWLMVILITIWYSCNKKKWCDIGL